MENKIEKANEYFQFHKEFDAWYKLKESQKEFLFIKAEQYINNTFDLRNGTTETDAYFHAICEQAIFLVTRDLERYKLQNDGVTSYKIDDISFQMNTVIISPVAHAFLKKYIYKKLGEIV